MEEEQQQPQPPWYLSAQPEEDSPVQDLFGEDESGGKAEEGLQAGDRSRSRDPAMTRIVLGVTINKLPPFVMFFSAISLNEVALLNATISLSTEYRVQSDQEKHVTLDYSSNF